MKENVAKQQPTEHIQGAALTRSLPFSMCGSLASSLNERTMKGEKAIEAGIGSPASPDD